IVISFAEPERLGFYQTQHQWPFVVLADPKRGAYRAFALKRLSWFRVFSPSTLMLYVRLLREGRKFQHYGNDDHNQAGGEMFLEMRKGGRLLHKRQEDDCRTQQLAHSSRPISG